MTFVLNNMLANDTVLIGRTDLSQIRLMKDKNYHWLILIPEVKDTTELSELTTGDFLKLMMELHIISQRMKECTKAHKINIASLGNLVPQLHIHIIARFCDDPAWPKPVWGAVPVHPYGDKALLTAVTQWKDLLEDLLV